jgi:hypothetical protein
MTRYMVPHDPHSDMDGLRSFRLKVKPIRPKSTVLAEDLNDIRKHVPKAIVGAGGTNVSNIGGAITVAAAQKPVARVVTGGSSSGIQTVDVLPAIPTVPKFVYLTTDNQIYGSGPGNTRWYPLMKPTAPPEAATPPEEPVE